MTTLARNTIVVVAVVLLLMARAAPLWGGEPGESAAADPPLIGFDPEGPLEPFVPKAPSTEQQQDRLYAIKLFGVARLHENRDEYGPALRNYQRMVRYDPSAREAHEAVVTLALRLRRYREAGRYAARLEQPGELKTTVLVALGKYLSGDGQWREAQELLELALPDYREGASRADYLKLRAEMGRLAFVLAQWDKAAEAFDEIVTALDEDETADEALDKETREQLAGKDGRNWALYASALVKAGRFDRALKAYGRQDAASPDAGRLAWNLAQLEQARDRPEAALDKLEKCFAEKYTAAGAGPLVLLDQVLEKLQRDGELLERLEKLWKQQPDFPALGYRLARQYLAADRLDDARGLLEQLAGDRPPREGYVPLTEVYRRQKQYDKLLDLLGKLVGQGGSLAPLGEERDSLTSDPKFIEALLAAARVRQQGKDAKLSADAAQALAELALRARRFDDAARYYELAIDGADKRIRGQLYQAWGLGLLMAERTGEAIGVLRRALDDEELADERAALLYHLAGALELAGKTDEALTAAREAAQMRPKLPAFANRVAWVSHHARRDEDALADYRAMLKKFDDEDDADTRETMRDLRLNLSALCERTGRHDEAEEYLEQVLDEFPGDIGAMNDLGYLWADRNVHLNRSLGMIEQAVAAEPENTAYRDSLAWIYYRLGRYQEAVAELEKIAGDEDVHGEILDHLGDAYLKAGKRNKAIKSWRQSARAYNQDGEADEARSIREKIKRIRNAQPKKPPVKPDEPPAAVSGPSLQTPAS